VKYRKEALRNFKSKRRLKKEKDQKNIISSCQNKKIDLNFWPKSNFVGRTQLFSILMRQLDSNILHKTLKIEAIFKL